MVVLTIVSRVVLELFQPQRVPGRLRLQLVRSREAEQEAVEAEEAVVATTATKKVILPENAQR